MEDIWGLDVGASGHFILLCCFEIELTRKKSSPRKAVPLHGPPKIAPPQPHRPSNPEAKIDLERVVFWNKLIYV